MTTRGPLCPSSQNTARRPIGDRAEFAPVAIRRGPVDFPQPQVSEIQDFVLPTHRGTLDGVGRTSSAGSSCAREFDPAVSVIIRATQLM